MCTTATPFIGIHFGKPRRGPPGLLHDLGSPKKIKFTGKSAGDIIEDYLEKLGYPSGSDQWFSLAHIVIERGEFESQLIGQAFGDRSGNDNDDGRL